MTDITKDELSEVELLFLNSNREEKQTGVFALAPVSRMETNMEE